LIGTYFSITESEYTHTVQNFYIAFSKRAYQKSLLEAHHMIFDLYSFLLLVVEPSNLCIFRVMIVL